MRYFHCILSASVIVVSIGACCVPNAIELNFTKLYDDCWFCFFVNSRVVIVLICLLYSRLLLPLIGFVALIERIKSESHVQARNIHSLTLISCRNLVTKLLTGTSTITPRSTEVYSAVLDLYRSGSKLNRADVVSQNCIMMSLSRQFS